MLAAENMFSRAAFRTYWVHRMQKGGFVMQKQDKKALAAVLTAVLVLFWVGVCAAESSCGMVVYGVFHHLRGGGR